MGGKNRPLQSGQSGQASDEPVGWTSTPTTRSRKVAAAVATAKRYSRMGRPGYRKGPAAGSTKVSGSGWVWPGRATPGEEEPVNHRFTMAVAVAASLLAAPWAVEAGEVRGVVRFTGPAPAPAFLPTDRDRAVCGPQV